MGLGSNENVYNQESMITNSTQDISVPNARSTKMKNLLKRQVEGKAEKDVGASEMSHYQVIYSQGARDQRRSLSILNKDD